MLNNDLCKGTLVFCEDNDDIFVEGLQCKNRPFLIISNNTFNKYSPVVNAIPLTTRAKRFSPVHVLLTKENTVGLRRDSIRLCEQISTIPKSLCRVIGRVHSTEILKMVDKKLAFQFDMQ